jgi:NitT/TauT family transport system substrate-binding protein
MAGNHPTTPQSLVRIWGLVLAFLWVGCPALSAPENGPSGAAVSPGAAFEMGIQPVSVPLGVVSAVMQRDRLLRAALKAQGMPLHTRPALNGAEFLPLLADHRMGAAMLGDLPALYAAAAGDVWIAGIAKQSRTAIVTREISQMRNLAGKRIGYVPSSTSYHVLMQGLVSAGLGESDVTLVVMSIDDMPQALERGDIDAFSGWEPAPVIALAASNKNKIVFKGLSSDYLVIGRDFAQHHPQAALQLLASMVRAIGWMQESQDNVKRAARWQAGDSQAFTGHLVATTQAQVEAITWREILSVPSAPAIEPTQLQSTLQSEYRLLGRLGKLPAHAQWESIVESIGYDAMARVLADPQRYRLNEYDYDD